MSSKKELKPHLDYLEECLELLKEKISEAKSYMQDVRWQDLAEVVDREKEFKFQSTMVDKYVAWLNEYAKLSGVIDAFDELTEVEDKDIRKGSYRSAFADKVKKGQYEG